MQRFNVAGGWLIFGLLACSSPSSIVKDTSAVRYLYVAPDGDDKKSGSKKHPWATIQRAAEAARPGDTIQLASGVYHLTTQVSPRMSGEAGRPITIKAADGGDVILDAERMELQAKEGQWKYDQGAIQIEGVQHIRVEGLKVINSRGAGITIRDSSFVEVVGNTVFNTYSSGIAAWDSDNDGTSTHGIRITRNTVENANNLKISPVSYNEKEAPHEAISVGGARYFDVGYNHILNSNKEGIDIKETSSHGRVHHNYVHHVARQGIYIDSWVGQLKHIEVDHNVIEECDFGLAISVENGESASDLYIHHNLIIDNEGSGIFFSRWGDGLRKRIRIEHNTVYNNGHGKADKGEKFHWLTGGIFLYSSNLQNIKIANNIVSHNKAFQIAYSDHYGVHKEAAETALLKKKIAVHNNLIFDTNRYAQAIKVGWPPDDYTHAHPLLGVDAIVKDPKFMDAANDDYRLSPSSAGRIGASTILGAIGDHKSDLQWWRVKGTSDVSVPNN